MKKVYYIGWYIADEDKDKFVGNVPGNLKMHYVVDQLKRSGHTPEIISFVKKKGSTGVYMNINKTSQECKLTYLTGIRGNSRILKKMDFLIKKIIFTYYFLFNFSAEDTLVLYHSVELTLLVAKLKRLVKRNVIIEVEEIYGYSAVTDRPWVEDEIDSIKKMDLHICVNDGIPQGLKLETGKFVVSLGVGNIPTRTIDRFNDGKIHVVYAGTIEMKKLGAMTAVESAKFLPDYYILHILGFGSEENMKKLKLKISEVNNDVGSERIKYDGYKSGKELDDFLFSCHIGLSSIVMRPNFANNSFPSKVITYMCHDLSVVLGYAEAFYDVPMSRGWQFYHEYTPEKIAEAITKVEIKPIGYYHPSIIRMNSNLQAFFKKYC